MSAFTKKAERPCRPVRGYYQHQADHIALKNSTARRELVPAAAVEAEWSGVLTAKSRRSQFWIDSRTYFNEAKMISRRSARHYARGNPFSAMHFLNTKNAF
jgi:hypothetical protein